MIQDYRRRFRLVFAWLALVCLFAAGPALAAESVQGRGNLEILPGREVADVVVADGHLRIGGTVQGSVFVAAGDVLLESGARVQGSLTVIGGNAWLSRGARVGGDVSVFAGQAHLEEGAVISGAVKVTERDPALTPEKIELISRYLLLERAVPGASFSLDRLDSLNLAKLRLRRTAAEKTANLDLGGLGKMPLEFREVLDARELRAEGLGRVRIGMIQFTDPAAAERFWDSLREFVEDRPSPAGSFRPGERHPGRVREDEIRNSVHSSLGEGAHWFFRSDGSSYLLWTRGQYLIAVQSAWFHDTDNLGREEWKRVEQTRDEVRRELEAMFQPKVKP